jgi:hypothetical protein
VRQQVTFLKDPADRLPLFGRQGISEIKAEFVLHITPATGQVLEPYLGAALRGNLSPKAIKS